MEKELPKNWVKVFLYDAIEPVKTGVNNYTNEKEYFSTGSVNDNRLVIEGLYNFKERPSRANREVKLGDVLQARMSDTNKAVIVNKEIKNALFSTGFMQFRVYGNTINPRYLFHYVKSDIFLNQKNEFASGTTQVAINDLNAKKITFLLPPLSEQNRIVEKLDRLFGQLEVIKSSMEKIPVLLKNFRQQVLTQAMTGNDFPESLGNEIFEFITSGSRGWAQYYSNEGNELFIRITNLSYGTYKIDLSEEKLQFLKLPSSKEGKRTLLRKNDLLISITADTGMIGLVEDDLPYNSYVNQHICLARPKKDIFSKYLVYYLMSSKGFGQFKEMNRGATKVGLTLGDIRNLRIPLPPLREQQEIVSRVETLFAKADSIEEKYKNLKAKIETLPQTILHKAFKGELSEQLETDGDARDLLEEIVALKNGGKAKKAVAKKYVQPDEVLRIVAEADATE